MIESLFRAIARVLPSHADQESAILNSPGFADWIVMTAGAM